MLSLRILATGIVLSAISTAALAKPPLQITVTLQNHRFSPAEIVVPMGTPVELTIHNLDPLPEEFDSSALQVEQVVPGGMSAKIRLRPLGPGRYPFMGEYHSTTAQGAVISK